MSNYKQTAPQTGCIAETKFILECLNNNYDVFTSYTSYSKCDIVILVNGILYKIQVKSTNTELINKPGNYNIFVIHSNGSYNNDDVDFFACYIVPLNDWYILPFEYINTSISININTNDLSLDIHKYKNNFKTFINKKIYKTRLDSLNNLKTNVISDYDLGLSLTALSIKYDTKLRTIRDWIKLSNKYLSKKRTASKIEILKLYNKKLTMNEIAVNLGLTLWTTRKLFRVYGIIPRGRHN